MAEDKNKTVLDDAHESTEGAHDTDAANQQHHFNPEDEAPIFVPQGNATSQKPKHPEWFVRIADFFKFLVRFPVQILHDLVYALTHGREAFRELQEKRKEDQKESEIREQAEKDIPGYNEKIARILEQQMKSPDYQDIPTAIKSMTLTRAPENHPEFLYSVNITLLNNTHYQTDAVFNIGVTKEGTLYRDDTVPTGILDQAEALLKAVQLKAYHKDVADNFPNEVGDDTVFEEPPKQPPEETYDTATDVKDITITTEASEVDNEEIVTAIAKDKEGKELMSATLQYNEAQTRWDIAVRYTDKKGVVHECQGAINLDGTIGITYPSSSTVFENAKVMPLLAQTVCNVCAPTIGTLDSAYAKKGNPALTPAARYDNAMAGIITKVGADAYDHLSEKAISNSHTLYIIPTEDRLGATVLSVRPQNGVVHLHEHTIESFSEASKNTVVFKEGTHHEEKLIRNGEGANARNANMAVRACIMMHESFAQSNTPAVYPGLNKYSQHIHIPGDNPVVATAHSQHEGVSLRVESALTHAQMDTILHTMKECRYPSGLTKMSEVSDKAIEQAIKNLYASDGQSFSTYTVVDSVFVSYKDGNLYMYSPSDHAVHVAEVSKLAKDKDDRITMAELRKAVSTFAQEHTPHEPERTNEARGEHTNDTHDEVAHENE